MPGYFQSGTAYIFLLKINLQESDLDFWTSELIEQIVWSLNVYIIIYYWQCVF